MGGGDVDPHDVCPGALVPVGIYDNSLVGDTHKWKRVHLLVTQEVLRLTGDS